MSKKRTSTPAIAASDGANALDAYLPRDALTGLLSPHSFAQAVAQQRRNCATGVSIAFIELRGLARYNDEDGRDAGDTLLAALGRRLDRLARAEFGVAVSLGRTDGARFGLIAPEGVSVARLRVEVRAFAASLGDLLPAGSAILSLRVALGTIAPDDGLDDAFRRIARRLAGSPSQVRAIDVEAALDGDALSVLFQPQVEISSGAVVGAEALVRWNHPRLGEVGGAVLFAAAATAGLERALSNAVWKSAMLQMAPWPRQLHGIRVAVNLTSADIVDNALAEGVLALAQRCGVAPDRLAVELTEADAVHNLDAALNSLGALRRAGLKAALDDFGSGYSGLSWLKHLPVDYIKIDSAFARDADGSARDQTVLRGVIALAQALDLDVLAEGVETVQQRDWFGNIGCRWFQGFLCAPALSSDEFVDFALRHQPASLASPLAS